MALKMMTLSETDKQFLDDNMLTDDDFQFDYEKEFEINSGTNLLKCFSNDRQMQELDKVPRTHENRNCQLPDETLDMTIDDAVFEDFLKECGYEMEIKIEPHSPYSSDGSQSSENFCSSEADFPVISISDSSSVNELNAVVSDTPPNTPPSLIEHMSPESPVNISGFEPQIALVNGSTRLPYIVPRTVQPAAKNGLRIQPKLMTNNFRNSMGQATSLIANSVCKPVVLNPEQFAKLANGTLKIKTPVNVAVPISNIMPTSNGVLNGVGHSSSEKTAFLLHNASNKMRSATGKSNSADVSLFKRQQRMIKNRESACLSRKKKKEYVQKLESEVDQVSAENFRLREENCRLRVKVTDLENEIIKLRSTLSSKTVKRTTCLMAVLFMLTFNLASYSKMFETKTPKILKRDPLTHHVGRSLLWQLDNKTKETNSEPIFLDSKILEAKSAEAFVDSWETVYNSSFCPNFINKTESLRLESDLLGWVQRVEKKQKLKESIRKVDIVKPKLALPFPKLPSWPRHQGKHQKDTWAKRKNQNEILIYQTPRKAYEDFFDAIHRRDDTFYFVSFSGDHMLLPATSHNETHRPRMSIVMPAMTFNDSMGSSNEHISMMQIDCEVMNTKLVYIKESVIPEHLRQKLNSSSDPQPKRDQYYSIPQRPRALQKSKVKLKRQGDNL